MGFGLILDEGHHHEDERLVVVLYIVYFEEPDVSEQATALLVLVHFKFGVDQHQKHIHEVEGVVVLLGDLVLGDEHLNLIPVRILDGEEILSLKRLFVVIHHLIYLLLAPGLLPQEGLEYTLVLLQVDLQTGC